MDATDADELVLVAALDAGGAITVANDKLGRLYGHGTKALVGRSFTELLAPGDARSLFAEALDVARRGLTWRGELAHVAASGEVFWTEASLTRSDDGFRFVAFDVTERKAVERALASANSFSRALMASAPTGVFVADAGGSCTYVNERWCAMTGRRLADAIGAGWLDAVHPADRPRVAEAWTRLVAEGTPFEAEYRYVTTEGAEVWVMAAAMRTQAVQGGSPRHLRIEHDLTERRRSEALIAEQRAMLVAASRLSSLGEMAGGIAHEINNPLAVIAGHASLLRNKIARGPLDPEATRRSLDVIHDTTLRISKIVGALLTIARDGRTDPFEETSVSALLDDALRLCGEKVRQSGVALELRAVDAALSVKARRVRLSQVLLHLLGNALDAVQGVPGAWIEVEVVDRGERVEIIVSDSGRGIPPEHAERIFEPFFTTKPVGSGAGLGLSVSRAIAQEHGGDLTLDRASDATRFVLTFVKDPESCTDGVAA